MADQKFLIINLNQEIQLVADSEGTLTFTSDDLPEGVVLSSDGILTNFTADGTYTFTVKCSSSYGTEASAEITVKVDFSLLKTQNNLTSDQSNQNFYVSQRTTMGSSNAWKAMDGNKSTYSQTRYAAGQTDWWQIEFVSPIILSQIYLKMDNQSSTKSYLQASNDGSNWVNLMTSTITDPFDGIIQLNLETPYKYYRFLADRTNYYILIYEVVFYYKYVENYLSAKDQTINAKLDEQFTYQIEYSNYSETPVEFSLQSELPEGIQFDDTTGTFSGSSSVQITKYLTVTLTNTYKTIQITITLNVYDGINTVPNGLTYWQPFDTSYITPKIGNNITLVGTAPILQSINGVDCVTFNGEQYLYDENANYWQLPTGAKCATMTFSFWIYFPENLTANDVKCFTIGKGVSLSQGFDITVAVESKTKLVVQYQGHYTVTLLSSFQTGKWYHIAAKTYDGKTMRVFLDGISKGGQDRSYRQLAHPFIGICCRWYNGGIEPQSITDSISIAQLKIYNRALTDQEIALLATQLSS